MVTAADQISHSYAILISIFPVWFLSYPLHYLISLFCAEILDFGYPQNSETGALKTFITQQGIKGQVRMTSISVSLP